MKHVTHRIFQHEGTFYPQYWNSVEERWMYFRRNGEYIAVASLEEAFILIKDLLETERKAGNEVIYNGPIEFRLYISMQGCRAKNIPLGFDRKKALQEYERQHRLLCATNTYIALYGLSDNPLKAETLGNW